MKRGTTSTSLLSSSTLISSVKATSTQSNGCVVCPSVKCPDCGDNYYCVMTSLTCTQCPITYCARKSVLSSTTTHKSNTGAIAGGVVGGVVGGFLIVAFIIYFFRRSKKRNQQKANMHDDIFEDGKTGSYYDVGGNGYTDEDNDLFGLDEYEPTRNKTGSNYFTTSGGNTLRSSNIEKDDVLGVLPLTHHVLGKNKKRRNDETSSVSTGNASNIIPVGYIPGIKSNGLRGLKTGTKKTIPDELKSHYTLGSSILGDIHDDEVPQSKLNTLAEEEEPSQHISINNKAPSSTGDGSESDFGVLVTPAQEMHQTALRGKVSLLKISEDNENSSPQSTADHSSDDDDSIVLDIDVENH
ncbi:uncharacterized protein HGUI_01416 [Hanseniaspora guilliermondii]|uniref:Membrane anchor Opy2 N-terminal domain-containing protein n=1 Tax=Hanseniaspora guilliermondii TaxID=56406 RepID=A0A1L0AYP4_9ASCO|nr:uncharacterized protein HGUI_01416 [Hanseniaspora guilliermondii]